jgi:hypothetical protein
VITGLRPDLLQVENCQLRRKSGRGTLRLAMGQSTDDIDVPIIRCSAKVAFPLSEQTRRV